MDATSRHEGRDPHRCGADLDRRLTVLATEQHGVVAVWQLWPLGFGRGAVRVRVGRGDLVRLHHGVYAVGHTALRREGRWLAAVLACGPRAVASHRCAAALHGLWGPDAPPEVTVPTRGGRARRPFRLHRAALAPEDVAVVAGVPSTSVARTLVDLAARATPRRLERAVDAAEVAGVLDVAGIDAVLERLGRPRGASALRAVLRGHRGPVVLRSELEAAFRALLVAEGLPLPVANGHVALGDGRFLEVDCLFPASRVAIELDGRRHHDTVRAFEEDRRRDIALQRLGWRVLRVTWRRLHDDRAALVEDLAAFLPRRGAR